MNQDWVLNMNAWSEIWANAMLRSCWQGALCIIGVWALCRLLSKMPAAARCGLWWLACGKLLLGLLWATPITLALLPDTSTAHVVQKVQSVMSPTLPASNLNGMSFPTGIVPRPSPERVFGRGARKAAVVRPSLLTLCFWAWGVVVLAHCAVVLTQWLRVRRWVRRATPLNLPVVGEFAKQSAKALGLRRLPRLMLSHDVSDALVTGCFQPTVLLEATDTVNLSVEELHMVLAHEFAHIRRGDLWFAWAPLLAQVLFWFHPLVWLACQEFDLTREEACDAEAIQSTRASSSAYGRLLLKLGAKPNVAPLASALGVVSGFKALRRRIVRLEHISQMSARRRGLLLCGLCGLMTLVAIIPWRMVAAQTRELTRNTVRKSAEEARLDLVAAAAPRNLSFAHGLDGWSKTANGDNQTPNPFYKIGIDTAVTRNGVASPYLTNSVGRPEGYGALRQDLSAIAYRGKRLRLSAYLKTEAIKDYTGLFISLEGEKSLTYAMTKHPIKGTTDWTKYEYVVDVPQSATLILFGVSLKGKGKIWASDFRLDAVGKEVALTQDRPDYEHNVTDALPDHPLNIDFARGLEGWGNDNPQHNAQEGYTIGLDDNTPSQGRRSPYLASIVEEPQGYGTLMQNFLPKAYRGKRLRVSASLRVERVENYAGLWIVLGTPKSGAAWHGYMQLKGTRFWEPVAYVLDVPKDANFFSFGLALEGKGKIWINDLKFEVVGKDVPATPPTQFGDESYPGNTARVTALWQLGRAGKYPELLKAAQAIVDAADTTAEERVTALDSVAYAYVQLNNYPEAKKALDRFDRERKGLNIDPGVIAEAKRLRADEPGNISK